MDNSDFSHPVTIHRWSAQDSSSSTSDLGTHASSARHPSEISRIDRDESSETTLLRQHNSHTDDASSSLQQEPEHEPSTVSIGSKTRHLDPAHRQWWKPLVWMLSFILLAIVFAAAHHGLNATLNTRPISSFSQTWAHNLGTGLAFAVKTCCTLTIALTCQEVLWYSVQQKSIRVSTLDNMFTLLSNPFSFGPSTWKSAGVLSALAATAWLIPIAAILSPGTLTVGTDQWTADKQCDVPTYPGNSNSSTMYTTYMTTRYVDGPDGELDRLASQVLSSGTIAAHISPCLNNCTYQHQFYAPALDCPVVPRYLDESDYWGYGATFYYGRTASSFNHRDEGQIPMDFTLIYKNITKPSGISLGLGSNLTFVNCSAYNASYLVHETIQNGMPKIETQVVLKERLFWYGSLYNPRIPYPAPQAENNDTYLIAGYDQANAQALVKEVYTWLNGTIDTSASQESIAFTTKVSQTLLLNLNSSDAQISRDLVTAIPELLINLTLSTFTFGTANTTVACVETANYQAYQYSPLWLVLPYTLAILTAGIAAVVAVVVLRKSGFRTGKVFSQILVTTRNVDLDNMASGNSLSSVNSDLRGRKLRFGQIVLDDKHKPEREHLAPHAAFGEVDRVVALKRNMDYI